MWTTTTICLADECVKTSCPHPSGSPFSWPGASELDPSVRVADSGEGLSVLETLIDR